MLPDLSIRYVEVVVLKQRREPIAVLCTGIVEKSPVVCRDINADFRASRPLSLRVRRGWTLVATPDEPGVEALIVAHLFSDPE